MPRPTATPEARLARLLHHVRRGWKRVRADAAEREHARHWLHQHPSRWSEVDALWLESLSGPGALAAWLDAGSTPESWSLDLPLHSVLASHPFACLSPWSSPIRSSRS